MRLSRALWCTMAAYVRSDRNGLFRVRPPRSGSQALAYSSRPPSRRAARPGAFESPRSGIRCGLRRASRREGGAYIAFAQIWHPPQDPRAASQRPPCPPHRIAAASACCRVYRYISGGPVVPAVSTAHVKNCCTDSNLSATVTPPAPPHQHLLWRGCG